VINLQRSNSVDNTCNDWRAVSKKQIICQNLGQGSRNLPMFLKIPKISDAL